MDFIIPETEHPTANRPFVSEESLQQLDWPWVVEQVKKRLHTGPAREQCQALLWLPDREAAARTMAEVEEIRELLTAGDALPLGSPPDIRPLQPRIEKGALLAPDELLDMASWMDTVERVRRFLVARRQRAPLVFQYADTAPSLSHLIYDIRSCIDEKGEVRDEASPELSRLRSKSKKLHRQIHERLERTLHAGEFQDLLQDRYYTIKEDRYVLPIKTSQRVFVDGIVLGSSSSGATLFIEPREIVDLNNSYKLILLESQREMNRILQQVCDHIGLDAIELRKGHAFVNRMDMINARAELSNALNARIPTMDRERGIQLFRARHPLIQLTKSHVVANDILLSPPVSTLLVTGPNAGGKTVVLKTVGLYALMVRAGLAIPADEGSNVPFFDRVFSDIGDSQSLQEDLSTFSGHILRIVDFLASLAPTSLALLDEILIGTDPEEGSALAQANLEYLADAGVFTLASTHFLALKSLAAKDPRVQNASLGYDPNTLEPNYDLTAGLPGSSNAFHIAKQFGLPAPVLERARSLLGRRNVDMQGLLLQIQAAKEAADEERSRLREQRDEVEALQEKLQAKSCKLDSREEDLKKGYRNKLEAAFREALRELERIRRRDGKTAPSAPVANTAREIRDYRHMLFHEGSPFYEKPVRRDGKQEVDWAEIRCGDTVYLPALQTEATILKLPDRKGTVTVEAKGFRMQVNATQVLRPTLERKVIAGKGSRDRTETERWEADLSEGNDLEGAAQCDLRGLTVEEACQRAAQCLDRGFRANRPRMILIHGLGKGVLRKAIRDSLSQTPYPLTFRPGRPEEGGDGVTVVEFDFSGSAK
jgi:DNA mismatch repair protein MutS2